MICHWGKLRLILSFSTVKENVETITYTQKSALDQFVNPSALVSEHTVLKVTMARFTRTAKWSVPYLPTTSKNNASSTRS